MKGEESHACVHFLLSDLAVGRGRRVLEGAEAPGGCAAAGDCHGESFAAATRTLRTQRPRLSAQSS